MKSSRRLFGRPADLEDFRYLEELSQMASKRWLEIRKTMNAA